MSTWWQAVSAGAAVLLTTAIGLLTGWWKERPAFLASARRYRAAFTAAVGAAVVLAVVQALLLTPGFSFRFGADPGTFLDQVPVELGGNNVSGQLPRALAGRPGYDHPIVVGCATGTAIDQVRDVRYVLGRRYTDLHATVAAYAGTADGSLVQVRLYRDSQVPVQRTVAVGASTGLDLDLTGVDRLLVRVTCQSPEAFAILAGARLSRA